jgi:hypothetical protein
VAMVVRDGVASGSNAGAMQALKRVGQTQAVHPLLLSQAPSRWSGWQGTCRSDVVMGYSRICSLNHSAGLFGPAVGAWCCLVCCSSTGAL